jgi:transposase
LKQQWCVARVDAEYLLRMEDILALYAEPYDPQRPVVCFDEMPIRLLENIYPELPARPDKPHIPRRQDYSYEPHGLHNALVFFEPLAGSRHITISNRKTKAEFAQQLQHLNALYPDATTIRLVMDNYSTHKLNCLYEVFPAAQARELARKLEIHYTPKHASWLNMVEIELSIFARQCLRNTRVPSPDVLRDIATTYETTRNQQQAKITWAFKIPDARTKLNHLYSQVYVP